MFNRSKIKVTEKILALAKAWLQPRPYLLAIMPMHIGHLNNTFYVICHYNHGLQGWCITHVHLPTTIVIRYSIILNLLHSIAPEFVNWLRFNSKIYPTGMYTPLPSCIRLTSNVQVIAYQSANAPITHDIIAQVCDHVLQELNKSQPHSTSPLNFNFPDLSVDRVIH